jgi:ABC-type multidrug transport system permease subunit
LEIFSVDFSFYFIFRLLLLTFYLILHLLLLTFYLILHLLLLKEKECSSNIINVLTPLLKERGRREVQPLRLKRC